MIGALLVAFVQVFGAYYLPDLALAFMYLIMLIVLVVRPGGLLGKEALLLELLLPLCLGDAFCFLTLLFGKGSLLLAKSFFFAGFLCLAL